MHLILVQIFRFAFGILKRFLSDDKIEGVKGLSLTADGMGAVFDVPAADVDTFLKGTLREMLELV